MLPYHRGTEPARPLHPDSKGEAEQTGLCGRAIGNAGTRRGQEEGPRRKDSTQQPEVPQRVAP